MAKPEDTKRLKKFNRLRFGDVSAVTKGGHQGASIAIKRNLNTPEKPMTFLEKLAALIKPPAADVKVEEVKRGSDGDDDSPTTGDILRARAVKEHLYRVSSAFEESMWRIMSNCKGKDLVTKLKRSADEYGDEMDKVFTEHSIARADADIDAMGKRLLNIATVVTKEALADADIEEIKRNLDPKNDKTAHDIERRATIEVKPTPAPSTKESDMSLAEAMKKATPAEIEELKRSLGIAVVEKPAVTDPVEILRNLANATDAKAVKAVEDIVALQKKSDENTAILVARLDALEKDKKDAVDIEAAKEFMPFLKQEDALTLVRSGNDALKATTRGLIERSKVPNLLGERGSNGPGNTGSGGSAAIEIQRKAAELVAKEPAKYGTVAEARDAVRSAEPALAKQERDEG